MRWAFLAGSHDAEVPGTLEWCLAGLNIAPEVARRSLRAALTTERLARAQRLVAKILRQQKKEDVYAKAIIS